MCTDSVSGKKFSAYNTRNKVKKGVVPSLVKATFSFIMKSAIVIHRSIYLVFSIRIRISNVSEMNETIRRHSGKH